MAAEAIQGASAIASTDFPAAPAVRDRWSLLRSRSLAGRSLYFVNCWLDSAVIGGLSIAVFIGMWIFASGGSASADASRIAAVLSLFVNYPHFSATNYRLYQSVDNIREFPVTALALPIVMVCFVAAALWQPAVIAPYLMTLYLLWSPYHYSGQTVGITMIYARRAGFDLGRWGRFALSAFVFSTFIVSLVHRQPHGTREMFGIALPPIPFPVWFDSALTVAMYVAAAAFAVFVVVWSGKHRRLIPPIVLLPAAAQFTWFIVGVRAELFYVFVPLFHSLQYLYIAWAMQMALRSGATRPARPARSIGAETLWWGISNYVGGIGLFIVLPLLVRWVDLPFLVVTGTVVAAVNIHHFFVDGVIWKLRNAPVTSALMVNIGDLAAARRPVPA
jgi:hypothetical protein